MQIIFAKKCKRRKIHVRVRRFSCPDSIYIYILMEKSSGTSFVRRRCIYVGTCLWHVSRIGLLMHL